MLGTDYMQKPSDPHSSRLTTNLINVENVEFPFCNNLAVVSLFEIDLINDFALSCLPQVRGL